MPPVAPSIEGMPATTGECARADAIQEQLQQPGVRRLVRRTCDDRQVIGVAVPTSSATCGSDQSRSAGCRGCVRSITVSGGPRSVAASPPGERRRCVRTSASGFRPEPWSHRRLRLVGVPQVGLHLFDVSNLAFASSVETVGATMTRSPGFQSTGVEIGFLSVAWRASMTRTISSKLRPTDLGRSASGAPCCWAR